MIRFRIGFRAETDSAGKEVDHARELMGIIPSWTPVLAPGVELEFDAHRIEVCRVTHRLDVREDGLAWRTTVEFGDAHPIEMRDPFVAAAIAWGWGDFLWSY